MQLSKNFSLGEFTHSATAKNRGLNNSPNSHQINNLKILCEKVLQPIRDNFNRPVKITSGFRSRAVNEAIRGAVNSQHSTGEASDFVVDGVPLQRVINYIRNNLAYDQLILYKNGWIHVSYSSKFNRHQYLIK
jgi:zinc D-Ala-D-Ala carboxypeptidase